MTHHEKGRGPGAFVADEFLDARHRHRADGSVNGREQPAKADERDRAE